MSKISWSEFIIVWLTVCVVIDMVLIYLNKKSENKGVPTIEERKTTIKQLFTPYSDDVAYDMPLRRPTMMKVAPLVLDGDAISVEAETSNESKDVEAVELTELQQETSDIVKMLFG